MGGVGRVTTTIANSLSENGENVTILDFSGLNSFFYELDDDIHIAKEINKRTPIRKIYTKLHNIMSGLFSKQISAKELYKEQLADLITHLDKNNYDMLIFCQGDLTALIPCIKDKFPNLKVIAWQHNEYHIYTSKYYVKFLHDYLNGIKLADAVICLTVKDQKDFRKFNQNTFCIYNPSTMTIDETSDLTNKNIIFVGRLAIEQKGLDYLLEIAESLELDWKIKVAGDGEDREKFLESIRQKNLEDKIQLLGSLGVGDLKSLYLSGSIFISTSRWEGFGLVITEAMAAGIPIISFDNNGPLEIVKDNEYGVLVKGNDVNSFIMELRKMMQDHELRKYYQQKSLQRSKDFAIENIIKEWYQVFNKIKK
ncbi:glycosyltransferase [Robertmurraya korlensis]|uniref:glycosyltransferase n=1 Tax=Robertmurraya korlensis TaxID=519977 RepID=UPI00203EF969|nr:glycosyltransferase [Robertmurraya korlensis]MCM3602228.1 glycosyltransferase [Robertmurraya korlensis]